MADELHPKPANLTDADWKHGSSDGEIFVVIRDGVKNTGMKAFGKKLTTHQIWDVVNYVQEHRSGPKPLIGLAFLPHENRRRRRPPGVRARRCSTVRAAGPSTPSPGARLTSSRRDFADADALIVRSATAVDRALIDVGAASADHRPRGNGRRQRRRRRGERPRHSRRQRARREQHQRRRARVRADAGAGSSGSGGRPGHERRPLGQEAFPRHRAARQNAWRRGPRTNRPGGRVSARAPSACTLSPTIPYISSSVAAGLGVELVSARSSSARRPTTSRSTCRRRRPPLISSTMRGSHGADPGCESSTRRAAS